MAGACPQHGLRAGLELLQQVQGHKGLGRAAEAAAVHTDRTRAAKNGFRQRKGEKQLLVFYLSAGNDILQIYGAGAAV